MINSSPTLTNLKITDNSAISYGGGMYSSDGMPNLSNVTFSNNSSGYGGGMYNSLSSAKLTDVNFISNIAEGTGGGLYNHYSNPELTNVNFERNQAVDNGGGISNNYSDSIITNARFISNSANDEGGGIHNFSSSPNITNAIFYKNTSNKGGGIYNISSSSTLNNVTITANSAETGGGILNTGSSDSFSINNSIIWENIAYVEGAEISNVGDLPITVNNSIVKGGFETGTNVLNTDPLFVDFDNENLRLQANSPAINAGNNAVVTVEFDLDGNPRIVNETVDIGAYEFSVNPPDLIGLYFDVIQEPLQPGNNFDVEFAVKNQGAGNAENFVVSFYASDNDWFSPNDTKIGSYTVENLAGNSETEKITTNLTLPNSLAAGDYFLGMIVDAENQIVETNKENNTNQGKFSDFDDVTINSGADLKGKSLDILSENLTAGDIFRLAFNLENTGSGNSANFDIDFYLSDNEFISENDKYLGTYKTSLEGNSETGDILTAFILPEADDSFWKGEGTYYVGMLIDTENEVLESNEGNNGNTGLGIDFDAVEISLNSGDVNGVSGFGETPIFGGEEEVFI